jgi:hypothetical protein
MARSASVACLLALLALFSPRLALVALWLFGDLLGRAFESWLVPLIGFFVLPWTTLAYAVMWSSDRGVNDFEWFLVVVAFLVDVGAWGSGGRARRRD